jgi:hypothetical protein
LVAGLFVTALAAACPLPAASGQTTLPGRQTTLPGRQTTLPGFLTILLAHSAETATDSHCHTLPGIVTLEQQAAQYQAMKLSGITGTVVTHWADHSTDYCIANLAVQPFPKPLLIADAARLRALAATYGWRFVSASRSYTDVTALSAAGQRAEICGSLNDLKTDNLPGATGLFAYPNDHYSVSIQTGVTATCYDYGRIYRPGGPPHNNALPVPSPYFAGTFAANGGACNDSALPCYNIPSRYRYVYPGWVSQQVKPGPAQWVIVQGYRFATGAWKSDTLSWDCTSSNWQDHWTSGRDATELYCWNDWLAALKLIPHGVVTSDPASVFVASGGRGG